MSKPLNIRHVDREQSPGLEFVKGRYRLASSQSCTSTPYPRFWAAALIPVLVMASVGKYVFINSLKEVRFHLCQTSEHSAATRSAISLQESFYLFSMDTLMQERSSLSDPIQAIQVSADISYRAFLTRAYPTMKKNNPHIPILIREAMGVEPKIWTRYEYGREKMAPLTGTLLHYPTLNTGHYADVALEKVWMIWA